MRGLVAYKVVYSCGTVKGISMEGGMYKSVLSSIICAWVAAAGCGAMSGI
jgi:hypothetical protein